MKLSDQLRQIADQLDKVGAVVAPVPTGIATSELDAIINGKPWTTPGGSGQTDYRFTGDPKHVTAADVRKWEAAGKPERDADDNVLTNLGVPTKEYAGGSF